MINIKINNREYSFEEKITILHAAKKANLKIPTLCYNEKLAPYGSCRLCSVEVKGKKTLMPACVTRIEEGMEIKTHSEKVRRVRKIIMELIIASHGINCNLNCLNCSRSGTCEIREVAEEIGITEIRIPPIDNYEPIDNSSFSIVREPQKCIVCNRCVRKCAEVQNVNILTISNKGPSTHITTFMDKGMGNVDCTNCGQCILECPTGALHEVYHMENVWNLLENDEYITVVQTAPAVRVAIAEEFKQKPGTIVTGQMVEGLKLLGFDKVFDTNFAADLTIMEEGTEFINRLKNNGKLPLFTSCSPGWIKFIEHNYPEYLDNLSSCKSPQQMFGAIVKNYYAKKLDISPDKLKVVSVMPCTAKKYESQRNEMSKDVDFVLTTRELAKMFKHAGIDLCNLPESKYDNPLGESTGAAVVFGTSGGVMEAALRTAYEIITGLELENLDFNNVRGIKGIKEATIKIGSKDINIAVANGLGNARILMEKIKKEEKKYHFVEFMACPGGCIGGGGQPIPTDEETLIERMTSLYDIDKNSKIRKSHENPYIKKLYEEYLGEPNGGIAHEILHTHYTVRG
ncbi:NADH-dependent [FeFe] hydrogenase, group A6 [Geotoga petraea]|uniref:NAD(P)-dependent iron-only hydrogenase catalytic subunit n=1 Tax=Geotoga petraea TaxID=28234 RepID=A0A1G6JZ92_9BACT|nr:NADH-dependent [FeFe] hydrogenase, group A6 [Geotoga petraea]SDC24129.1 NAD(P)-dependent iron-only hydrogenase catalytic subunit [Geotoga petraea]